MNDLQAAIWAENLKVRRSTVIWIIMGGFVAIALGLGFLSFVLKNPEFARNAGLIGTKAQLVGTADWPSNFDILTMVISGLGLVAFGFVASWLFGREYSDHTAKDLMALPVPRVDIVLAKFIVMAIWCVALSIVLFVTTLVVGWVLVLPGWSTQLLVNSLGRFAEAAAMTIVLSTPVAFFASYGRGYLAPMGYVIGTLAIAQFAGMLGFGAIVPWAIPGMFSGAAGPELTQLPSISYVIVVLMGVIGIVGTALWWESADQT